jgi:hypothetical protein
MKHTPSNKHNMLVWQKSTEHGTTCSVAPSDFETYIRNPRAISVADAQAEPCGGRQKRLPA